MSVLTIRPFADDDVDYMTWRQAEIFEEESGFRSEGWRSYISGEVREFVERYDKDVDCAFILESDGIRAGCMAVTHRDNRTAQLRFLFVEPELRRTGIGEKLFVMAIDFCRSKGYEHTYLWTVAHLKTARRLYVRKGFKITETCENNEWGVPVTEERWDLDLTDKH
ncbi:MAG: GNAT family N-acetyltransferase [Methanomassiliicoccaceae archaeon]|jgi:GNAT superfamily N-acetyltransferase|nr:GNAT family N-acetyltransferase [Methanomassiliicoccaceae archaeon]